MGDMRSGPTLPQVCGQKTSPMAGKLADGSAIPTVDVPDVEAMTEEQLRVESHLVELESMGFTIIDDALPPPLLARLKENQLQVVDRVRSSKEPERHSWESPKEGVVDAFRLYAMDDAYEQLLTLPKVFPIIDRAIREGRGRPGHAGGPRLYHEMMQHHPAGTEGGQGWHRDGDLLRCTFTLNDLPPSPIGGGTVVLPGSHRGGMDEPAGRLADSYGAVLNSESIKAKQRMPSNMSQTGPAGSCMVNWTMLWHSRPVRLSLICDRFS